MIYFYAIIIFFIVFFVLSILVASRIDIAHNNKKLKNFERFLLWKQPKKIVFLYVFVPRLTKKILKNIKSRFIEQELLNLIDEIRSDLNTGQSITETMDTSVNELKQPLKNIILMFLILAKKIGKISACEEIIKQNNNPYLKIFFSIILSYYKSSSSITDNLNKLYKAIYTKQKITTGIQTQLIQSKLQIIVATVLPYLLLFVINIMYPGLGTPVFNSSIGISLLFIAITLHVLGVLIFIKIGRFDSTTLLNEAIVFEYISLSLKSGKTILSSFKSLLKNDILAKNLSEIISQTQNTEALLSKINKNTKSKNIQSLSAILHRSYKHGVSVSEYLENKSEEIMQMLENRANRFQQTLQTKSLVPLLFFIFPATYTMILLPIILEVLG